MSNIQIFDVSGYVNTIEKSAHYKKQNVRLFPVSGMHFFLRKLTAELRYGNRVVCCFDGRSTRSSRFPGYKGSRKLSPSVVAQCEFLYDFLSKCGVACYKGFGEADDYIYNIAEQYYESLGTYNFIDINGSDYDLCHNVTEFNVRYKTVNKNTNNVDWQNFSTAIGLTKEEIIFNTVAAYKVLCGDSSDEIPGFTTSSGVAGVKLYRKYAQWWKDQSSSKGIFYSGRITRSREILMSFLNGQDLSEKDISILESRANAIYPKDLTKHYPDGFTLSDKDSVNLQLLSDYCFVIKDFTSLSNIKQLKVYNRPEEELGSVIDELFELGKDFDNGAYMADRNLSMKECKTFSSVFNVREI